MLHKELSKDNDVDGFYSIARSGFGWQKIISNFMVYCSKYGKPDYLFVMVPDLCRFFEWHEERSAWVYLQRITGDDAWAKDKAGDPIFYQQATEKEYRKAIIDFKISWDLFEKYCESIGTNILWGTWEYEDSVVYKDLVKSPNYIDFSYDGFLSYASSNRQNAKMLPNDLFRRDGHSGVLHHEYWLDGFKKEIAKREWFNV
jgi:hypothetical protein